MQRPAIVRAARPGGRATLFAAGVLVLAGCGGTPTAPPTIGAPPASPTSTVTAQPGRPDQLRLQWQLTGVDLPTDWPDVALPLGTQVSSAYAVDSVPRRTWTASFVGDTGTAARLAKPVVKALRKAGYQPISAYASQGQDAGLYSFKGPNYSVYLVLGDLDGHPNIVMTVRQRGAESSTSSAALPSSSLPAGAATPPAPTMPSTQAPSPAPSLTSTSAPAPSRNGPASPTPPGPGATG